MQKSNIFFRKEIYDGLSAVYDYAQNGVKNIKRRYWNGNQWFK
jgi:glycyl-tRNA synthetase (class II)